MMRKYSSFVVRYSLLALVVCTQVIFSSNAHAAVLTPAQLKVFREGINFVNTEDSASCDVTPGLTLPGSTPAAYKALFEQAAAKTGINPAFLAAIFVTEHGNTWPSPDSQWASSSAGASGPFQFMPGTWREYGNNGNIQNLEEATAAAARLLKALGATTSTPLGTLQQPYTQNPRTFMYIAGAYNAGSGTMELRSKPTSGIEGSPGRDGRRLPDETVNYVKNVYYLLTSNFVNGNKGYGNAEGKVVDNTAGKASAGAVTQQVSASGTASCSSFTPSTVVDTAVGLAWPDEGHGKNKEDATEAYQKTMPEVHTNLVLDIWSDCGVFVATVMRSTKADPEYHLRSTSAQLDYGKRNPDKFEVIQNVQDSSQFKAGDIIIYDKGHTVLFVGEGKIKGFNAVDASWKDHVPQAQKAYIEKGGTHILRLKGGTIAA